MFLSSLIWIDAYYSLYVLQNCLRLKINHLFIIFYLCFRFPARISLSLCGDLKRGKVDTGMFTVNAFVKPST